MKQMNCESQMNCLFSVLNIYLILCRILQFSWQSPLPRFLGDDYNYERTAINESRGGIFRDSVEQSVSGTESRRTMTYVGDEESGEERAAASSEREAELALSLFETRSKTRDTTVARYISKVKDLLFSLLSLSRSTFAIIPLSIDLSLPRARCALARVVDACEFAWTRVRRRCVLACD